MNVEKPINTNWDTLLITVLTVATQSAFYLIMNTEKSTNANGVTLLITILTVATQSVFYLLTGGFAAGGKLSEMNSEIKLLRQEVAGANQIQDYRLDKLEDARK